MTMKPLNVLVVDDEIPLRQELRLFPWETCGAVLIGEAGNGEEALRMCGSLRPDVVVTDITMPIMDGITLIRELRKQYPAVQIILLTCHSDFHYVQEALRLGALEYILKVSMEEEQLKQALDKVRVTMVKERNHLDTERSERRSMQAALFGKMLNGNTLNDSDCNLMNLDGKAPRRLVRFILDTPNAEFIAARQWIQQTLNHLERSDPNWMTWLSIRDKEYFVLLKDVIPIDVMVQSIEEVVQTLRGRFKEHAQSDENEVTVHAVISESFHTKEHFSQTLAETTVWKEVLFYDGCSEQKVFLNSPIPLNEMTESHLQEMNEMFRKVSRDAILLKSFIQDDFLKWCVKQRIRPLQLKQRLLSWQTEWLQQHQGKNLVHSSFTWIMEAQSLPQMITCLVHDIEAAASGKERTRVEIRSAKLWIQSHLKQPISLLIIAEQVGLSPHYISRLFREETGETVNQYITRLRMEKAVDLLQRTNKKVYEIAEEVGIPSYRYFTATFRNWTGVAPTDYKRQS